MCLAKICQILGKFHFDHLARLSLTLRIFLRLEKTNWKELEKEEREDIRVEIFKLKSDFDRQIDTLIDV